MINALIKIRSEIGLAADQQNLLNILTKDYINILKPQELRDAQAAWIEHLKRGADRWAANMAEWNRLQAEDLRLQRQRDIFGMIERRGFPSELRFDPTASEGLMFRIIDPLRDLVEELEELKDISNEFLNNLSRTLGDFLASWGRTGGKPDIAGAGLRILQPAATQWGIDLAALWKTGGFMAGPIAGAIMGGAGWIAGRLMGEEPLKIEQPVDIRIVDIETRLKDFFNFRGLDPFTHRSDFQSAFENGIY